MDARSHSASSPLSASEILLGAAITLAAVAIFLMSDPGGLNDDGDTYMHLARFRDGYGIFHGGFVPRDNAPYGTVLPWTMPFDGALAVFYVIGRAFTDRSGALYFAARIVSPFFCAAVGPLIFFGLRPFFSLRARVVMAGLAVTSPALLIFGRPGEADYHTMIVWLSVLFAVALIRYLFLDRPRHRHAAAVGIAAAGVVWASLEAFIIVGTGLSALVLHRCIVERPRADRTWVKDLVLSGAFALTLTVAWPIDRPYEGLWALKVDRLSIVYVSFAWLFAVTLIGLDAYLSRRATFDPSRNLIVAVLLGGAAFLCWVAIEPDVLKGPFGQVDSALVPIYLDTVGELQPMWRLSALTAPHAACLILIWILFAVLIVQTSGLQKRLWIACAILMIPVSLVGIRYVRAMYYTEVLGSIPLGLVLSGFTRRFPKYIGYSAVAASAGVMFCVYIWALLIWDQFVPPHQDLAAARAVCSPGSLSEAIAPIENTDAIIMTEVGFAPWILYLSPHLRTVAGPFHRNTQGILDVLAFFAARNDDDARAILDKRGSKFVLICDTGEEVRSDFFGDRILHETPAWLEQVGSSSRSTAFRLYRVRSGNG